MAKRDKDYENRMAGYILAYNMVKEKGIDALEKDIKLRNILHVDVKVNGKTLREDYNLIARKTVMNIMSSALWALHDTFGFGRKRLMRYKEAFENVVKDVCDLDYLGERYVRLEDFAVELNERYNLGIDVECVAACQDVYDKRDPEYRSCKIDRVLQELRNGGYKEAAEFIEQKLY